jgi:predicted phosphate transport protein (TIGR00153 family)
MERSYSWFEKRRRTQVLTLAQEQITKALDTVTLLSTTMKNIAEEKKEAAMQSIETLFEVERTVDKLRTDVFKELSKGTALFTDYREDIMNIVNRLDDLADYAKDAARCVKILVDSPIPNEFWVQMVGTTSILVDCASALRSSLEKIAENPKAAIQDAKKVDEIENQIDAEYLKTKALFVQYGGQLNCGALVIFDHLVEFVEQAADMCADTADYIIVLATRE